MTVIAFDRFEFDPETLELSADGQRIDLAPKPGLLLKAMIEATPGIVTREEARNLLWPDGFYADPEQGLNACVRQLRAALGDGASSPKFVETLSKRGYRLIVPVRPLGHKTPAAVTTRAGLIAGVVVLASAVALLYVWGDFYSSGEIHTANELDAGAAEYLARAEALRARHDAGDLEDALGLYERVLEEHPSAAPALAGKAIVLVKLGGRPGYPRKNTYEKALEFVELADAIGPVPDAAAARAYAMLYGQLNPAAALTAFEEAINRDDRHAESYVGMAAALSALGRTREAIETSTAAAHIDPLSYSARSDRCWYLLFDHRFEEAAAACSWAIEIDGDHTFSYLGLVLAVMGDQVRMQSAFRNYLQAQGLAYEDGDIESGAFTCRPAERMARQQGGGAFSPYEIASFYGLCNDASQAKKWLEQAAQRRQPAILYFPYDPRFDAVRSELTELKVELDKMRSSS